MPWCGFIHICRMKIGSLRVILYAMFVGACCLCVRALISTKITNNLNVLNLNIWNIDMQYGVYVWFGIWHLWCHFGKPCWCAILACVYACTICWMFVLRDLCVVPYENLAVNSIFKIKLNIWMNFFNWIARLYTYCVFCILLNFHPSVNSYILGWPYFVCTYLYVCLGSCWSSI